MTALFDIFKKKKPQKPTPEPKEKIKAVKKPDSKTEPVKKTSIKRKDLKEAHIILKEPHISEKSTQMSDQRKYIFRIYPLVNKIQVKKAVSSLYGVAVKDVRIINIKSKERVLRGKKGTKPGYKKAIVTLEEGYKIELMPH